MVFLERILTNIELFDVIVTQHNFSEMASSRIIGVPHDISGLRVQWVWMDVAVSLGPTIPQKGS